MLCTVRANQISEFRYVIVNGYIRDQICAQVVDAAFDNALMLLRERMGSKKLLLHQREQRKLSSLGECQFSDQLQ